MTPMHRYACALFACVALLAGGTAAVNVARDPLGLFTQDFSGVRQEPAQHFLKMRYVLAHPGRYDSFAFGSSRMAKIDLSGAGDGWYTLSYSQGTPAEWLRDVQMLVAEGVPVRRLLVGLDDASFRLPGDVHDEDTGFRRPYRAWDAAFYLQELFRRPQRLDTAWAAAHGSIFDIYGTGRVYVPERVEAAIDADPVAHAEDERLFASSAYTGNCMEETLRTLAELRALANAHGIELTFFFHPIYQTTYMDNDLAELDEFQRRLAEITPYYDFSGLNEVTQDPQCYYESSHYRPPVGDRIVARIYGGAPAGADEWGAYVTAENVEAHLSALAAQRGPWEAAHPHFHEEQALRRGWTAYVPERFGGAAADDGTQLACHIDRMPEGGRGRLAGWLVPGTGRAVEALAMLTAEDGTRYAMRVPLVPRPDVVRDIHSEAATGFDMDIKNAPPAGRYTLRLLVRTEDGSVLASGTLGELACP